MHNKYLRKRLKSVGDWNQHYENRFHHRQVSKKTRRAAKEEIRDELEGYYSGKGYTVEKVPIKGA